VTVALLGLFGGLALLLVGAELLVAAAARLVAGLGVPPLVVGLTVVAFGTSAPELAVSLRAALDGSADLAVGNVVGSNVFNVLFILGVSALVAPLAVPSQLVRVDVPIMIGTAVLAFIWALDGQLDRSEGGLLVIGLGLYIALLVRMGRAEVTAAPERGRPRDALTLVIGLVLLSVGARLLVDGAVAIATAFGISEAVIGVTIVAAGTSLPEIATSVLAARRGQREIALGNIVGSNIFNVLSVLGLSALVAPAGLDVAPALMRIEFPTMLAVSIALLPICASRSSIARWEGFVLLSGYVGFTTFAVLQAMRHPSLPLLTRVVVLGILPLALVGLVVDVAIRHRRRQRPVSGR
jgi:cation:H+ antiporter